MAAVANGRGGGGGEGGRRVPLPPERLVAGERDDDRAADDDARGSRTEQEENDDDDDDNEDGDSATPIIANERGGMAPVYPPYSRIPGRILTTFVTPSSPECRVIHTDIRPSPNTAARRMAHSDLTSCRERTGPHVERNILYR